MKKGSITCFLCMILLVMLSLVSAGMYSARQAAARVVLLSAAEQSLYSQFARYDRELFDRYGLLFIDGGYGGEKMQSGRLLRELREDAEYIMNPRKGNLIGGDILGMRVRKDQTAITGYVLATDDGGKAFRRQVCGQMRAQLGVSGVEFLRKRLSEEQDASSEQEAAKREIRSDRAGEYYAEDQQRLEESGEQIEPIRLSGNPIEQIKVLKKQGLLALVLPAGTEVSSAVVDPLRMLHNRPVQQGIWMDASGWEDPDEKLLMLEYLVEEFPCFLERNDTAKEGNETAGEGNDPHTGNPIHYQVEYVIGGYQSDADNLKSVMHRLLAIREAANLTFLMSDPEMRSQVDAVTEWITVAGAGAVGKVVKEVVAFLIRAAWAFGESVLDLRNLYEGKGVPMMKSKDTWQLSIFNLGTVADSDRQRGMGLDYEEYLRLMLMVKNREKLVESLMDLTEYNIRQTNENFRLDNCIDALSLELAGQVDHQTYLTEQSYGYANEWETGFLQGGMYE